MEATPEAKVEVCCGAENEAPVEERLHVIDKCLDNREHGTYGICEVCPLPVDPELLTMDCTGTVCLGHYGQEELRQLENEFELSQAVPRALLPQQAPAIPGLSVAAFSRPAQIVSGDYFDFIQFKDGGHGIGMADLSGHGVSAGMLMTCLQMACHTLVPLAETPLEVLERINHPFAHNINFTTFVTIFFGKLGTKTRTFTYGSAGYNFAYLYRAANGEGVLLHPTGTAIGLMEAFGVRSEQVELNPEDTLVLYTDGVTEASNRDRTPLGLDALAEVVRLNHPLPGEGRIQRVLQTLSSFNGGSPLIDDATLVVCKVV